MIFGMGIFDFGGLCFWLFDYVFDWWNEIRVSFFLMINLVYFDLVSVV